MSAFWNNPHVVSRIPVVATALLIWANLGQIWRMWSEHTAAGQNLWSWFSVFFALLLWLQFYRVCCPKERFAYVSTLCGIAVNVLVIFTVVWFRYVT